MRTIQFAAALLVGGQASRLGYCAKGNLCVAGKKTIIEHELTVLREVGISDIIIAGNYYGDKQEVYAKYNCPYISDLRRECGPLAGIESALSYFIKQKNSPQAVVFLPCDLPNISAKVIKLLLAEFIKKGANVTFACTKQTRIHPLCAVVHLNCLSQISKMLERNEYSVQSMWFALQAIPVNFEDESLFLNINSPGDFP